MICKTYELGSLKNYKFVVVLSRYDGRVLLSRHRERSTWETQGGHIEQGEAPMDAAKRELYEESVQRNFLYLPCVIIGQKMRMEKTEPAGWYLLL